MPKVSIIIPTYNCARFLPESINSALAQSYQDFEIILVDDGSTDNTRAIVSGFIEKYSGKIVYVYQENAGLACARNAGLKTARGEYVALLDADDRWLPNRLMETVAALDANPGVGLVHANITRISEEGEVIATPSREERFLSGAIFEHIFLRRAHISCPTVLFRMECCSAVGMFDENLTRLGSEDRDLWLRISEKFKIEYINEVLAYYRISPSGMSRNQEKMMKAQTYVINKFSGERKHAHLRRPAFAKMYRDWADEMLIREEFILACRYYLQAIYYSPLSFWTWLNLGKAFFKIRVK